MTVSLFYGDTSLHLCVGSLMLLGKLAEVVDDDISDIVLLFLRRHHVGLGLESRQPIVALCKVVKCGNAVVARGVDGLSANRGRLQLSVFGDDKPHALTYTFAVTHGHLAEELQDLVTGECEKTDVILKRSHVEHVAIRHIAHRQRSTYATHVVDRKVRVFLERRSAPQQDVAQQIAQVALGLLGNHLMGRPSDYWFHDGVHLVGVRLDESSSLGIRLGIVTRVDENA